MFQVVDGSLLAGHAEVSKARPTIEVMPNQERGDTGIKLKTMETDAGVPAKVASGRVIVKDKLVTPDEPSTSALPPQETQRKNLMAMNSLYSYFVGKEPPKRIKQSIIIFVHDAWDLPLIHNSSTGESSLPHAFVSVKTSKEYEENLPATLSTHASLPSREASFAEKFIIDLQDAYTLSQTPIIHIALADHLSKRYLAKFSIPISCLFFPSYRQVSLVLRSVSPNPQLPNPHLRISIINIDTSIEQIDSLQREYTTKMMFMGFVLKSIAPHPLPLPMRCQAILRVVQSGVDYAARMRTLDRRYEVIFFLTLLKPYRKDIHPNVPLFNLQ
ncbi:hypothetical protein BC829DRAFT_294184 [Chytridium lagenaria]|nr:hypothetical protein BC829DRAFT_294184 [Chytridium lagenaria]